MPQQTFGQVSKINILTKRSPTFVQPIAFLSNSAANSNEVKWKFDTILMLVYLKPLNFLRFSYLNQASSNSDGGGDGGADEEKLSEVYEILRKDLPHFFVSHMNYQKMHKDIVFENRIRGKTHQLVQNSQAFQNVSA